MFTQLHCHLGFFVSLLDAGDQFSRLSGLASTIVVLDICLGYPSIHPFDALHAVHKLNSPWVSGALFTVNLQSGRSVG